MLVTKHGGRRRGIAIRDGSVAQARAEAGLTLAAVADGKLSRTAIHLIEKGLTRPSLETLKQIASQTRKPMSFFLQTSEEASQITERTRLQRAARYVAEALAAGEAAREASVRARLGTLLGQLEEMCGNTRSADRRFETAIEILKDLGNLEKLRDAHMVYAGLLDARGDVAPAARHWKLAANIGRLAALGFEVSASRDRNEKSRADAAGARGA
jgi:transcriptional regulator with XRE-family HTH domain